MSRQVKADIAEIILAIYHIPGQYAIGAMILFALWNAMKDMTVWAISLPILAIVFIFLEILSPIMAGKRLYDKAINNLTRLFK